MFNNNTSRLYQQTVIHSSQVRIIWTAPTMDSHHISICRIWLIPHSRHNHRHRIWIRMAIINSLITEITRGRPCNNKTWAEATCRITEIRKDFAVLAQMNSLKNLECAWRYPATTTTQCTHNYTLSANGRTSHNTTTHSFLYQTVNTQVFVELIFVWTLFFHDRLFDLTRCRLNGAGWIEWLNFWLYCSLRKWKRKICLSLMFGYACEKSVYSCWDIFLDYISLLLLVLD